MHKQPTMIRCLAFCLALLPGLAMARIAQQSDPPMAGPLTPYAMCEAAIASAEATTKLPARVLNAIALRESGRLDPDTGRWRPWPWTINVEGIGHFYDTKEEAIAAVQSIQAAGEPSVDVGCMQVNLMHHPYAFASLDDAFDPAHNAAYAGRFLMELFASSGDWGTAIAAYHSRTPGVGEPYRDQVVATWNPTDPAVLSKLSFQPLPPLPAPICRTRRDLCSIRATRADPDRAEFGLPGIPANVERLPGVPSDVPYLRRFRSARREATRADGRWISGSTWGC